MDLDLGSAPDTELLAAYCQGAKEPGQAEEHFAALIARHGGMVFQTCLRILGDAGLAEDAAQATFVVLAQKAGAVRENLGAYLHRVAVNASKRALVVERLRKEREREAAMEAARQREPAPDAALWASLRPHLDEAIERLPRMQRQALVLHCLQGRDQQEVAAVLGISRNSVNGYLRLAREKLHAMLRPHAEGLSVAVLAGLLSQCPSEAACPAFLAAAAGNLAASGQAASGAVASGLSSNVALLAKGAKTMMLLAKVKMAAAILVAAAVVGTGIPVAISVATSAEEQGPPKTAPTDLVPAERLAVWQPGITVGVPGGIPANRTRLIDVTKAPYNADHTGAADAQPAIMKAIADAKDNEVVYLPAGKYRIEKGIGVSGGKSRITIRGDGPGKTFVTPFGPGSGGIGITPGDGGDWWYENRLKLDIAGSPAKGATVLTVGDTKALAGYANGGIGQLCQIALKNDPKLPVLAPANFDYMRRQISRIVAKTPTTVTISPGLLFDLPGEFAPTLRPGGRYAESVGIEDLTVDASNSQTPHALAGMNAAYGCWIKNVTVLNVPNYSIGVSDSAQCEVRQCYVAKRKGAGSNGAGLLVGQASFCLFEDNILTEQFPHIEVNGSTGNVFAYNFCHDSDINGVIGVSICTNHGAHSSYNLYEGNVAPKFQSDGYHGSASHDTAFRNWFHGTSEKTDQFWICIYLNRFTRCYSLIGNVLGRKGDTWLYDNAENGFGYSEHYIYAFGLPNMGNGGFKGAVQPSKGKFWADWDKMLASERGKGPGPNGFQELDLDVKATTILKGNYNYKDNGVPASESLGGAALPRSLYLKEKPAWFGDLAWPAFGPDTDFSKNKIPAQVRFEAMKKGAGVPERR